MNNIETVKSTYPDAIAVSNGMEGTLILKYIIVRIAGRTRDEIEFRHADIRNFDRYRLEDAKPIDDELSRYEFSVEEAWNNAAERIEIAMLEKLEQ